MPLHTNLLTTFNTHTPPSSGRVYPLPFIDRIEDESRERAWDAVWLENEYVALAVLPELGGRIHVGQVRCLVL